MKRFQIMGIGLALALALGLVQPAMAAGPLAIQGAKIITGAGKTIESGTVLIKDGLIEAVGENIDIPGEALVIDASGKVVIPGYIDPHNAAGMSQANERNVVVPFLSVVDSIDPIATYFEECRRNGVTTAAVVPGNSTLIGGKAAIVKTAGAYVNDMLVVRDSALKLSLNPVSGSRMSHIAKLRKELDKAKRALAKEAEQEKEKASEEKENKEDTKAEAKPADGEAEAEKVAKPATAQDEGLAALKLAVQGKMPVYIYCELAMDVVAGLRLVEEYSLDPIFVLGKDCYEAASQLKKQKRAVILDPTLVFWETDEQTRTDSKIALPEIYLKAEVPFVFQVGGASSRGTLGSTYFWYQAATAVKYGLSEEKAVHALTMGAAELLGIADSVGSIEEGKEADLVILSGEPFDMATWVEQTIVDGEVVYERQNDEKLERLLAPKAE